MPSAPILITGGLGFLGSHLVARLAAEGATVRILARPRREIPSSPHEIVWADVRDLAAVERAVRGAGGVVHLASNFRQGGADRAEAWAVNVEGTRNVLAACSRWGVRRLVHCSTIGVHGSVATIPGDEETPFHPLDLYQETKLAAEQEVWRHHRATGLPVTVLRPVSLIGPGDRKMLKLFRLIQRRRFVMVGNGKALIQLAYIDDVVDAFVLGLREERAVGEAFIVGDDEVLPLRDLVVLIASELGVPPPRLRVPLSPVLLLAEMCERLCGPLGIEPPLHRPRVSFFRYNRAFSVEKARRILGFQPRMTLREAIQTTIAWYRRQGWI